MDINRFWMHRSQRRRKIALADHFRLAILQRFRMPGGVDDDEIVRGHRAQAHRVRRIRLLHPVPVPAALVQKSRLGHSLAQILNFRCPEFVFCRNRQLERRALQMIHQNFQVVRLHVSVFRRAPKKIIRVLHDKLIERRGRRHHHRARRSIPAPGPPGSLPRRRDRSRVSSHHAGVERSDVDAQFQRVRRYHAAHPPFTQTALDFPALSRQISAAISSNGLGLPGLRTIVLLQIRQQNLGVQPAVREHNRLQFAAQQLLRHPRRLVQIASANSEIAIHHRRIVKHKKFLRGGRAILLDNLHFFFDQLRRQLSGIRNRRRAANELRLRSIKFRDAPQPSQHVGQVAAEYAAVGMQLIDHDVPQIFENACPFGVMG